MKMKLTQAVYYVVFWLITLSTICFSENFNDYISNEDWIKENLNPRMSRWQSGNIEELLTWTDNVLENYPNLLKLHILKGHILFYRLTDLENAIYHYSRVKNDADLLKNFDEYISFEKEIDNLQYQANRALNQIEYGYGDLRFKIRGKQIPKFCYIRNMKVFIAWDEQVINAAEDHQRLRFNTLVETLTSGRMKFMFADFDSVDGRIYFKIPYFPMVESGIPEPYSMIINNEKRYHFNFDQQTNSVIEIDWNDDWELVEAVPDNYVKIEYNRLLSVQPDINKSTLNYDMVLSVPEENPDIKNIYIPIDTGGELDVVVNYKSQQQKVEKAMFIINRGIIIASTILILLVVR